MPIMGELELDDFDVAWSQTEITIDCHLCHFIYSPPRRSADDSAVLLGHLYSAAQDHVESGACLGRA